MKSTQILSLSLAACLMIGSLAGAGGAAQLNAALAEGDAAVHAACALGLLLVGVQRDVKLVKIPDALLGRQL